MAIAGPAVNLVIAGILFGICTLAGIPDVINPQSVGVRQLVLALAAGGGATSPQLRRNQVMLASPCLRFAPD